MTVAIVTGGAGAIGSVICRVLAERGDRVICADLKESTFNRAFAEAPANIEFAELDVTEQASWESICARVEDSGEQIASLTNAAAWLAMGPIDRLDHDAWRRCFDVTLHGAALGIHTVGQHMVANGSGAPGRRERAPGVSGRGGRLRRAGGGTVRRAAASARLIHAAARFHTRHA